MTFLPVFCSKQVNSTRIIDAPSIQPPFNENIAHKLTPSMHSLFGDGKMAQSHELLVRVPLGEFSKVECSRSSYDILLSPVAVQSKGCTWNFWYPRGAAVAKSSLYATCFEDN
jgi:hypothetical protein